MFWSLIYLVVCVLVGWFGSNRRFGFWGYFLFSIIFTLLVGLVVVIASDEAKPSFRLNKIVRELEELRCYIAKFESVGLTPAETRELAGRLGCPPAVSNIQRVASFQKARNRISKT